LIYITIIILNTYYIIFFIILYNEKLLYGLISFKVETK